MAELKSLGKRKRDEKNQDCNDDNDDIDTDEEEWTRYENLEDQLETSWKLKLSSEFKKPYWSHLKAKLIEEVKDDSQIYPNGNRFVFCNHSFFLTCVFFLAVDKIFAAFQYTPFDQVRIVIISQDPYVGKRQAEGLCFSVPNGITFPSSLKNIFSELENDIKEFKTPKSGSLLKWAKQGVLLLNTILTVRAGEPGSHKSFGWQRFTDAVLDLLNEQKTDLIFLLWGSHALKKAERIDKSKHTILECAHPSGQIITSPYSKH